MGRVAGWFKHFCRNNLAELTVTLLGGIFTLLGVGSIGAAQLASDMRTLLAGHEIRIAATEKESDKQMTRLERHDETLSAHGERISKTEARLDLTSKTP